MASTLKKASKTKTKVQRAIVLETKLMPTAELTGYYKNPRVGNVPLIVESLQRTGQYKPIIVNIGTKTGRKNEILVGNHTWLGARELAWEQMLVSLVDVDDETAARIVLVDNKSADEGDYDYDLLADIVADLPDTTGTGYNSAEIDALMKHAAAIADQATDDANDIIKQTVAARNRERLARTFDGAPLGEEPDPGVDTEDDMPDVINAKDDDKDEKEPDPILSQPSKLPGVLQLQDPNSLQWEPANYWGVPKLLSDMICRPADMPCEPEELDSWAGSATKDWPNEDQWWLYNWGIDSTSGMKDISKVIIGFFCYDEYFENWFYYPDRYVTKVLNSGIKHILTPDYSQENGMTKIECMYNLYRARWLGRYFQEAGLKVIPDITWIDGDMDWLKKHVLGTLPKQCPMIALQIQTLDENPTGGRKHFIDQVQCVFDTVKPEGALIYAGPPGRDLIRDEIDTGKAKLWVVGTRLEKLAESQRGRKKKTTI